MKLVNYWKNKQLFNVDNVLFIISVFLIASVSCYSIFCTSPMNGADEPFHYFRTLQISEGYMLYNGDLSTDSQWGGFIDKGYKEFADSCIASRIGTGSTTISSEQANSFQLTGENIFVAATNTVPYLPINYLPYIFGSFVAKFFMLNPYNTYLLLCVFGLLFYLIIYCLIVRAFPSMKLPLSLFALNPYFVSYISHITADSYSTFSVLLFIIVVFDSFWMVLKNNKPLSKKYIILISLLSINLVLTKIPNVLFVSLLVPMLIYFVVNNKCKLFSKNIKALFSIIILCVVIQLIYLVLVKGINTGAFWGRNVDTFKQISFMINNPIDVIVLFIKEMLNFRYLEIGILHTKHPPGIVPVCLYVVYYISLFLSCCKNSVKLPDAQKSLKWCNCHLVFSIIVAITYIVTVFLALYLQYNNIGTLTKIEGVQVRYFIPVIILFLVIAVYAHKYSIKSKSAVLFVMCLMPLIYYFICIV